MKTFEIKNGYFRVGDPCHQNEDHCVVFKVKNGIWNCRVETEEKYNNISIVKFIAEADQPPVDDYAKAMSMLLGRSMEDGGLKKSSEPTLIESGVVGFFDYYAYGLESVVQGVERRSDKVVCEDQPYYSICCDRVLSEDKWGEIPFGCVCSAGDVGYYQVNYYSNNSNVIVKVEIDLSDIVDVDSSK